MTNEEVGRRLRVLHLIVTLGESNGQYMEHCLPLINVRDLSICTYFEPQLTPPPEIDLFTGDGSLRGFFRAFRAALDAYDYDVVHCHSPQTGALAVLAALAWFRMRRLRPSMVYTVQDSFYDYKLRNQAMMVIALAAFKHLVFCSRAAYDSVPRVWRWLAGSHWRVVQNAADIERIDRVLAEASTLANVESFSVVCVGRLETVKDPATMVDAFSRIGEENILTFIGAGALEASIRLQVADLGLEDSVHLTGLVPRDDVFVRCARADVLVSTSRGEGLPVAIIEAMATGCPVILSDIPPHRELADGAEFIPMIPVGDSAAFADAIRRFRDMSAEQLADIGRRCRDHVTVRYTLPIMHAGIDAVYRRLPGLASTSTPIR